MGGVDVHAGRDEKQKINVAWPNAKMHAYPLLSKSFKHDFDLV